MIRTLLVRNHGYHEGPSRLTRLIPIDVHVWHSTSSLVLHCRPSLLRG